MTYEELKTTETNQLIVQTDLLKLAKECLSIVDSSTMKDKEITMLIESAIRDLERVEIDVKGHIEDNLVKNTVIIYVKAHFGDGDIDKRILNNINLSFKNIDGESLLLALDLDGICVSSGSACHSDLMEPSHVLRAIGVPNDYISGTLRISFGKNTTKKEIDYLIEKIKEKIDFIKGI